MGVYVNEHLSECKGRHKDELMAIGGSGSLLLCLTSSSQLMGPTLYMHLLGEKVGAGMLDIR
jgi:hypothetical protein